MNMYEIRLSTESTQEKVNLNVFSLNHPPVFGLMLTWSLIAIKMPSKIKHWEKNIMNSKHKKSIKCLMTMTTDSGLYTLDQIQKTHRIHKNVVWVRLVSLSWLSNEVSAFHNGRPPKLS